MNTTNIRQSLYQCLENKCSINNENMSDKAILLCETADDKHAITIFLTARYLSNSEDFMAITLVNGTYCSIEYGSLYNSGSNTRGYKIYSIASPLTGGFQYYLTFENMEGVNSADFIVRKELKFGVFNDLLSQVVQKPVTILKELICVNEETFMINNGHYVIAGDKTYTKNLRGKDSGEDQSPNKEGTSSTIHGFNKINATYGTDASIASRKIIINSTPRTLEENDTENPPDSAIITPTTLKFANGGKINANEIYFGDNENPNINESQYTGNAKTSSSFNSNRTIKIKSDQINATCTPSTGADGWTLNENIINGSITNDHLASNLGLPNSKLDHSSLTVGSTTISLGEASTILNGLSSVTSTNFYGNLSGNATTASNFQNSKKIELTGSVTGNISSNGDSGWVIPTSIAGSTVGTSQIINNSVTNDKLAGSISATKLAGGIPADKLAGGIPNEKLNNSSVTIGKTSISLGSSSNTLTGLTSVTSASFNGDLDGEAKFASQFSDTRCIKLTGKVVGETWADGSSGWTINTSIPSNAITVSMLLDKGITIGNTKIDLGKTVTSISGLDTLTAKKFSGIATQLQRPSYSEQSRPIYINSSNYPAAAYAIPKINGYHSTTSQDIYGPTTTGGSTGVAPYWSYGSSKPIWTRTVPQTVLSGWFDGYEFTLRGSGEFNKVYAIVFGTNAGLYEYYSDSTHKNEYSGTLRNIPYSWAAWNKIFDMNVNGELFTDKHSGPTSIENVISISFKGRQWGSDNFETEYAVTPGWNGYASPVNCDMKNGQFTIHGLKMQFVVKEIEWGRAIIFRVDKAYGFNVYKWRIVENPHTACSEIVVRCALPLSDV